MLFGAEMWPLPLPFTLSYIVLTPNRVRLPGENSPSGSSTANSKAPWSPSRWSKAIGARIKTFRPLSGAKLSCSAPTDAPSPSPAPVQGITEFVELYDQNLDGQDISVDHGIEAS